MEKTIYINHIRKIFTRIAAVLIILCMMFTLSSCYVSDFVAVSDEEYSYDMLCEKIIDSVKSGTSDFTLKTKKFDSDLESDVNKMLRTNGYISYFAVYINYVMTGGLFSTTTDFHISFRKNTKLKYDEILIADGTNKTDVVRAIAKKLADGATTVGVIVKNGKIDDNDFETISRTVDLTANRAYVFETLKYSTYGDNALTEFDFNTKIDADKRKKLDSELDSRISEISKSIKAENPGASKKQLCKAIHNYICRNASYDDSIVTDEITNEKQSIGQSAYGALVLGKTICGGYASAFMRLYDEIIGDNKCWIVGGNVTQEGKTEGHAWNIVNDGGVDYYIDCTFDDGDDSALSYDYFYEKTDSKAFSHHKIDKKEYCMGW